MTAPLLQRRTSNPNLHFLNLDLHLLGSLLNDHDLLVHGGWAFGLNEALGRIRHIFDDNLFLLKLGILGSLATAEERTPDKDSNVSNYHS